MCGACQGSYHKNVITVWRGGGTIIQSLIYPKRLIACVSADLDPSRFWIPYDVIHCLGMRSSLKCRKVTYKMCVAHPRKWIRFLLAGSSTVLADLDGQNLRFCERRPSFESARLVCVCSYNMQCKLLQVSLLISQFLLRYIGVCLNKHYSLKV